jgi:lipid II:glycine glycyltransferase (peptidoglycan interpeptide bridge formation enzyme)
MRKKTREQVRRGQRQGIRVNQYSSADANAMAAFYELVQDTSRRNTFEIGDRSYYEAFMSVFDGNAALFIAYLHEIPVAGVIVAHALGEAIFMFGGSSTEHRVRGAVPCLAFEAMRWARACGCKYADLFGISPDNVSQEGRWQEASSDDGSGYTHFKLGFGGEVIKYPPAWQRPVRKTADNLPEAAD